MRFLCFFFLIFVVPVWTVSAEESPFLSDLSMHRPTYFSTSHFLNDEGNEQGFWNDEVVFQISVKKPLYESLYFAYTQTIFWQLYDNGNSRSFRASNYNPEVFVQFHQLWGMEEFRLGLWEHQSNGERSRFDASGDPVNYSRTWNRIYSYGRWSLLPYLKAAAKLWYVTDRKENKYISFYDDNPDIRDYLGNGELFLTFKHGLAGAELMMRQGYLPETTTFSLISSMAISEIFGINDSGTDLYFQAFSGYGDNLSDYNRKIQRVAIGFKFR